MRMMKAALDSKKKVALVDFQLVDEASKADATVFFQRFAAAIAEQLELPEKVQELWDAGDVQSAELHALRREGNPPDD